MPVEPLVTPPCGPLLGRRDGAANRYTGIRYASAERYGEPRPVPDHHEPVDATQWSAPCPQEPSPMMQRMLGSALGDATADEHCQRLSVTVPSSIDSDERLPVMVWIHGGSYTIGAGDVPIMDPAALVAEQRVIVVTITYRLGLFGYAGGTPGRPANLGLLDQLAAFRWVRRNIAAFGGDPRRITAFGQSAGADAIAKLMTLPEAQELFSRAILQSAPLGIARGRERMSAALGRAAATVPASASVDDLVAAESAATAGLARLGLVPFGLKAAMPFGTRFGHAPLPAERDADAAADANAPHIDVLIGHTAQEARLFVPALVHPLGRLGTALAPALVTILTAAVYGRSARRFARRHARAGGRAHRYLLSWSAPGNPWGSAHMIDLPLLFGDEQTWADAELVAGASWAELDAEGRRMRALWARFARGERLSDRGRIPGVLRYQREGADR
ncbi:carboxylesterase family protein [Microbacteriaceae bacterium VKM Ac-2855]|nr:carboxylesterase family protein [Microbacteriaceae bacterium VKM Ac-2855]